MGRVFGKKKNPQAEQAAAEAPQTRTGPDRDGATPGKGRPTPSRKEREAARRRPLVPQDRKAARQADREAAREARVLQNQAMQTGDERYLPARDRGPQRRYARDFVDARRNVGDLFLVILLVMFVIGLFMPQQPIFMTLLWVLIIVWIIDTWLMWRKLKSRLVQKFTTVESGMAWYAWNRAMMIRRLRLPKPQAAYGQFPS